VIPQILMRTLTAASDTQMNLQTRTRSITSSFKKS